MIDISPKSMILLGFFLALLGFVLPFLMTLHIVKPTYLLSFVSWGSTTVSLFLGLIGGANYMRSWKN